MPAPIQNAQNLDRLVKMLACLLAGVKRPALILGRRIRSGFRLANVAGKATLEIDRIGETEHYTRALELADRRGCAPPSNPPAPSTSQRTGAGRGEARRG
jgi:hypothetical protein